jgi:hypothetical protein
VLYLFDEEDGVIEGLHTITDTAARIAILERVPEVVVYTVKTICFFWVEGVAVVAGLDDELLKLLEGKGKVIATLMGTRITLAEVRLNRGQHLLLVHPITPSSFCILTPHSIRAVEASLTLLTMCCNTHFELLPTIYADAVS